MFGLTSVVGQVASATDTSNNSVDSKQTKTEVIINTVVTEVLALASSQIAAEEIQNNSIISKLETEIDTKKIYSTLKRTVKIIREEKQKDLVAVN